MINHLFKSKCHNLKELFNGVNKFSSFTKKLEEQSLLDPLKYNSQKYIGDGFEFFVEIFLKLHPNDNRIGVYNYTPILQHDNGVDGIGVNIKLEPCVVQIKYRSDNRTLLTANNDHLSNMFSDGMLTYNVISDNKNKKNYRHFVFTTADGLHFYTDNEMFKGKVKCIGYTDFKNMLDNNKPFWENVRNLINNISI